MIEKLETGLIATTALGLAAIGLGYGINPNFYPHLFDHTFKLTEEFHVYRAINGLYLGISAFWLFSLVKTEFKQAAVLSIITIMFGLILGRVFSSIVDGQPHLLFQIFLGIEIFTLVQALFIYYKKYV